MKTTAILKSLLVSGVAVQLLTGCARDTPPPEEKRSYSITVSSAGNGTASANVGEAAEGETVTITATADEEYSFMQWTVIGGGMALSDRAANPAQFTMPASDVEIRADFLALTYMVTVSGSDGGTATSDKEVYSKGETVTITAAADEEYSFMQWTVVGGGMALSDRAANPAQFTMPASDVEIRADFLALTYMVTVSGSDGGMATSDKEVYSKGETVTITAAADDGYAFLQWVVSSGDVVLDAADAATAMFIMPAGPVGIRPVFVRVEKEANSYMARPGGDPLYIPVSQANRVLETTGMSGLVTTGLDRVAADNYAVELVWADSPVDEVGTVKNIAVRTLGGKGYVEVMPGAEGNAVVGIRVGGDIRWSWHVWVTGDVGEGLDSATGLTWMDRNLGAAGPAYDMHGRNGLVYQWGRKDAFPVSDGTEDGNSVYNNQLYYTAAGGETGIIADLALAEYTELPQLARNPLVFAGNSFSYSGSLNTGDESNDSWGGVSGKKSVFDPCPPGWRVPLVKVNAVSVWGRDDSSDWTARKNGGRIFNGVGGAASLDHYYPYAGYRDNNTGRMVRVGSFGFYWSAVAGDGAKGRYLYLTDGYMFPDSETYRTFGLPVRCVRE